MKNARAVDPVIKNHATYGVQWWMWYAELQPESRKAVDGHLQRMLPPNNEWTELRKGTINGVYGLLASLGWWKMAVETSGEISTELDMALSDVAWVLESMTRAGSAKRASPDPEDLEDRAPFKKARAE